LGEWGRQWGPTAGVVGASLVALALVAGAVYGDFHPIVDHVVYEAQVEALRDGSLTLPVPSEDAGPLVFTTVRGDEVVAKYLPGTAALGVVSDTVVGSPWALAAAGSLVLLVVATAGLARGAGLGAWGRAGAAAAVGLSPVVLALDSRLLSYVPGLAVAVTATWLAVEGVRRDRVVWFLAAGAALGLTLFFRQLEVVAWGAVLVAWLVWSATRPVGQEPAKGWPAGARRAGMVALGGLPLVVGVLVVSWGITGSPTRLPFVVVSPDDGPGFGLRRALDTDPFQSFDFVGAVRAAGSGLSFLLPWTAAGAALVVGAALALRRAVRTPVVLLLVGLAAVVPAAYLFQWSHKNALRGGHYDAVGPFYLLFMVPPLAILGVLGLRSMRRRGLAVGLVVAAIVLQSVVLWSPLARQREVAEAWASFSDEVSALPPGTLVLVDSPYRGKPFVDLETIAAQEVAAAADPARTFAALDRHDGWFAVVATTDLATVEGRQVLLPSLGDVVVTPWATVQRARMAVGCGGHPDATVVLSVAGVDGAALACPAPGVELELDGDGLELRTAGEVLARAPVPEGPSWAAVCARVEPAPADGRAPGSVCRRLAVERAGTEVRWVLPGRLDADAGVRGLDEVLGAVRPVS
jgi:hypothetical protein